MAGKDASSCAPAKVCGTACCAATEACDTTVTPSVCKTCSCGTRNCGQDECANDCGACTQPQTCDGTGHCVTPDKCTGVTCSTAGEACNTATGVCECTGTAGQQGSCTSPKVCSVTKKCVDVGDPCVTKTCPDATLPSCKVVGTTATCVCAGGSCGTGKTCNATSGACETATCNPACAATPETPKCDTSGATPVCICTGSPGRGSCAAGHACSSDGTCKTADLCSGVTCSTPGETCNTANGACECTTGSCTSPKVCSTGKKCVDASDPCATATCTGETPSCDGTSGTAVCKCTGSPNQGSCNSGKTCGADGACHGGATCTVDSTYGNVTVNGKLWLDSPPDPTSFMAIDGPLPATDGTLDTVGVELYAGSGVFANGFKTGPFTLAGDDLQYATCGLCVMMYSDINSSGDPAAKYMATGGTVVISEIATGFTATLTNLTFQHVDIMSAAPSTSTPNADGCTSSVAKVDFAGILPVACDFAAQTPCPTATQGCYFDFDAVRYECDWKGAYPAGHDCQYDNDCIPTYGCGSDSKCVPYCNVASHPTCTSPLVCTDYNGDGSVGYCEAAP